MNRRVASLLLLFLWPAVAPAYEWRASTNRLVLAAGETIGEEALWAAKELDLQGQARQDLWLLGQQTVRFDGEAAGDLRVLAGSAVVAGTARRNLMAYANGLQLATNSTVRGELALVGGTVICEGQVDGDAWIVAGSATLGGTWGGRVRIRAEEIRLAPGTRIAGDLVYTSPRPLVYDSSVAIAGAVVAAPGPLGPPSFQARFALHGYLFLAALLVGMPFVGFFPALAGGAVRKLRLAPWRTLLAGVAALLIGPFLAFFAFVTVVGLPLAVFVAAFYGALAYLSHVVIALWLGHRLLRAPGPQTFGRVLSALATGLFLLYAAAAVPGVAALLAPPVLVLGTGALVLAFLQRPVFPFPLSLPPPPRKPDSVDQPEA